MPLESESPPPITGRHLWPYSSTSSEAEGSMTPDEIEVHMSPLSTATSTISYLTNFGSGLETLGTGSSSQPPPSYRFEGSLQIDDSEDFSSIASYNTADIGSVEMAPAGNSSIATGDFQDDSPSEDDSLMDPTSGFIAQDFSANDFSSLVRDVVRQNRAEEFLLFVRGNGRNTFHNPPGVHFHDYLSQTLPQPLFHDRLFPELDTQPNSTPTTLPEAPILDPPTAPQPDPTTHNTGLPPEDEDFAGLLEHPIVWGNNIESDNVDFGRFCERLFFIYAVDPVKSSKIATFVREIRKWKRPEEVTVSNMIENKWDCQGIPWGALGMQKETFRKIRNQEYINYRNIKDAPYTKPESIPENRNFFRFRRQDNTQRIRRVHFQLRNLIGVTSKNDVYYAGSSRIWRTDPCSKKTEVTMDLGNTWSYGAMKITTMAANYNVVIAGGFHGEYAMKAIDSPYDSMHTAGAVTHNINGITNHVHLHPARTSGSPYAVFSSNDNRVRVLDCHANKFVGDQEYEWPVNCAATSPDGRLRVIVGDQKDVLITDSDRGMILRKLDGHKDYGFACAWSDDGYSIATGNQDKTVRIYDARNFGKCVKEIGAEIAGVRTLRFSANGTGRRVLVLAEPADYVSIIDAKTWDGMQRFEHFGEIGGVEFTPDGEELFVANTDANVGGLMEFERTHFDDRCYDDDNEYDFSDDLQDSSYNDSDESDEELEKQEESLIFINPLPTAPENWWSDDSCDTDSIMGAWESAKNTGNFTFSDPKSTVSAIPPWLPDEPLDNTCNDGLGDDINEDGDIDLDPIEYLGRSDSNTSHISNQTPLSSFYSPEPRKSRTRSAARANFTPMKTTIRIGKKDRRNKRLGLNIENLYI